jgi:hypothetical protein
MTMDEMSDYRRPEVCIIWCGFQVKHICSRSDEKAETYEVFRGSCVLLLSVLLAVGRGARPGIWEMRVGGFRIAIACSAHHFETRHPSQQTHADYTTAIISSMNYK